MKKFIIISLILLTNWSGLVRAKDAYVHHVIVNHFVERGLDYELNGPNSTLYTGFLNPGQVIRINMYDPTQALYGSYFLRYTVCDYGWFGSCKSYNQMLLVKQNEEIIWEITPKGVKIIETDC